MVDNFDFDVRISAALLNQLHQGEITPSMLLTMTLLYNWAQWSTGIVKQVSAGGLHTWSCKAYSERTFSETLRKLELMGWITRHMKPGSHKAYAVTIHNYKVTDDAGKVQVINPKNITIWEEFPSGRCEEGSDETSDEGSDETSGKTNLKPNLNMNLNTNLKNDELASQLVSSVPLLASLEDGTTSSGLGNPETLDPVVLEQEQEQSQNQEQPQMGLDPLAYDLVCEERLMAFFGLPTGQSKQIGNAIRIAVVLRNSNRSIGWLTDLVRWAFEHKKFWASRLHPAARGWDQLAKFLESGEIVSQFNAQLELKHKGLWSMPAHHNAYLLPESYWEETGNPDDVEFESEEGNPDAEPEAEAKPEPCSDCLYEDGYHHKTCKLKRAAGV